MSSIKASGQVVQLSATPTDLTRALHDQKLVDALVLAAPRPVHKDESPRAEANLTQLQHSRTSRDHRLADALVLAAPRPVHKDESPRAAVYLQKPRLTWTDGEDKESKEPAPSCNRVDYGKAGKWVQAHPKEAQGSAKAILRNTQRIPEAMFEKAIHDALNDLAKKAHPGRPLLSVCEKFRGELKSNHWLISRAQEIVPNLLEKDLFEIDSTYGISNDSGGQVWKPYKGQDIDLFLIDDASYSGLQMSKLASEAYQRAIQCGAKPINIYIALGCVTNAARKKIISELHDSYNEDIRPAIVFLGRPILLPTLTELVEQKKLGHDELKDIKIRYASSLEYLDADGPSTLTLSYMPHKIPDYVSTLEDALNGKVVESRITQRFIPETTPFYKKTVEYEKAKTILTEALNDTDFTAAVAALETFLKQTRKYGKLSSLFLNDYLDEYCTPLSLAARNGHVEVIKRLLDQPGIMVNGNFGNNFTYAALKIRPLIATVECGHLEAIKLLLSHPDINVNLSGRNGKTALFVAAELGHVEAVKLLLSHPDIDVNLPDDNKKTPCSIAAENGQIEVLKLLLNHPNIDINLLGYKKNSSPL